MKLLMVMNIRDDSYIQFFFFVFTSFLQFQAERKRNSHLKKNFRYRFQPHFFGLKTAKPFC